MSKERERNLRYYLSGRLVLSVLFSSGDITRLITANPKEDRDKTLFSRAKEILFAQYPEIRDAQIGWKMVRPDNLFNDYVVVVIEFIKPKGEP
jgi:hypothetical protein